MASMTFTLAAACLMELLALKNALKSGKKSIRCRPVQLSLIYYKIFSCLEQGAIRVPHQRTRKYLEICIRQFEYDACPMTRKWTLFYFGWDFMHVGISKSSSL